jgi:hypothetical protein
MSKLIYSTLIAVALLNPASAAMARTSYGSDHQAQRSVDSPAAVRAFWDGLQRNGS